MNQDELDGFVTGTEFDELKRHYSDFNFADLVIEFPNPDQYPPEKNFSQNKAVKLYFNMIFINIFFYF